MSSGTCTHWGVFNQNIILFSWIGCFWLPWLAWIFKFNFQCLIQWDSRGSLNKKVGGYPEVLWAWKLERQRTSGPQKRTKSDFIYCSQCYRPRSRKLDLPLSANEILCSDHALLGAGKIGPLFQDFRVANFRKRGAYTYFKNTVMYKT